jgi:hypothetical protein
MNEKQEEINCVLKEIEIEKEERNEEKEEKEKITEEKVKKEIYQYEEDQNIMEEGKGYEGIDLISSDISSSLSYFSDDGFEEDTAEIISFSPSPSPSLP